MYLFHVSNRTSETLSDGNSLFSLNNPYQCDVLFNTPPLEEKHPVVLQPVSNKKKQRTKKSKNTVKMVKGSTPENFPENTSGFRYLKKYKKIVVYSPTKSLIYDRIKFLTPSKKNLENWKLTTLRNDKFFLYEGLFAVQYVDDKEEYFKYMEILDRHFG